MPCNWNHKARSAIEFTKIQFNFVMRKIKPRMAQVGFFYPHGFVGWMYTNCEKQRSTHSAKPAPCLWQTAGSLVWTTNGVVQYMHARVDSRFAPSQWETVLFCNDVSYWLRANLESACMWTCVMKTKANTHNELHNFRVLFWINHIIQMTHIHINKIHRYT